MTRSGFGRGGATARVLDPDHGRHRAVPRECILKARLAETEAALADAVEAQRRLERIVGELQREKFGSRSEKLDPDQFNLPLEERAIERGSSPMASEIAQGVLEAAQERARQALKGGTDDQEHTPKRNRGHLPKHLPRIERVIEPRSTLWSPLARHWSERQWRRGCGEMAKIGEDGEPLVAMRSRPMANERLDIVPAQLRVLVTRRPRYACRRCSGAVVQAHAPEHAVPGGLPTEALIG